MPPCDLWHGPGLQGLNLPTLTVPGEGNCGLRVGFANGPPYTPFLGFELNGFWCGNVGGCTAPDGSTVPNDGTWEIGCDAHLEGNLGLNGIFVKTSVNASANNPSTGGSITASLNLLLGASNAQCENARRGIYDVSFNLLAVFPLGGGQTRGEIDRKTVPGSATDAQKLMQNVPGSGTNLPNDPFNPFEIDNGSVDVSGTWNITAEAVRGDVATSGLYYPCITDIQQSGKNLAARILCTINSTGITVNPQAAGGAACPGVNAKYCGNGQASGGPGCTVGPVQPSGAGDATHCAQLAGQGTGCPTLPCDVSQYNFADIDNKHTTLTGVVDNTTNTMNLSGCFRNDPPDGDGQGQLGNVYIQAKINIHTGQGEAAVYSVQTLANCNAGTPSGAAVIAQVSAVRQAPGDKSGGCTANVGVGYTGCRDSDGDGCPDKRELGDSAGGATGGGLRDPSNPFDYFNPEKVNTPHAQTVADILAVVGKYGKNQGNAAYSIDTDRTAIIGGNVWNLGLPDGQQT
ncbi:MAG: flexitail domain-containing putative surface protein, partial [bacterium]